jgi:hypothetical protein
MPKKWTRTASVALAATVAAGAAVVYGAAARADDADSPSSIVEDYSYPGAADILAQKHIKLISGDGHIILADCATPTVDNVNVLQVWASDDLGNGAKYCFQVLAARGLLTMDVPGVYEIHGDGVTGTGAGHQVTADVKPVGGDTTSVAVDPDGSTQVGLGANPNNPPTTLLKLTAVG